MAWYKLAFVRNPLDSEVRSALERLEALQADSSNNSVVSQDD
jgi:hypothetical protein